MKSLIYVTSSGRSMLHLRTLECLEPVSERVVLLVQKHELVDYARTMPPWVELQALPGVIKNLSQTRQWILDHADKNETFITMDDDLYFNVRRKDDRGKFQQAAPTDIVRMIDEIDKALESYVHVGVLERGGANRVLETPYSEVRRMMRVLAYVRPEVKAARARFDRMPLKQDFDMTLQLLRAGWPNAVLTEFTQDQGSSNAPGGCSAYRTRELSDECAYMLAELHPGYVNVVERRTKGGWFGDGVRKDVRVAWKRAYEENR